VSERRYTKILVAQHSPENGCCAEQGAVLYFVSRRNQAKEHAKPAGFFSASDHRTRSKFGWVAVVSEEFSLDEFVEQFVNRPRVKLDESGRSVVRQLLDAIAELHKVFFARRRDVS